ncbi:hypothetical protein J7K50_04825 [bacterium]|nr:hypothetical protein [bacterium]
MNEDQMNMENLIGKQVMLTLHPDAFKSLDIGGLDSPKFYATVSGFDGFGLWIEDTSFCVTPAYDLDGKYIPAADRKEECYKAHILILWSYIQTMIYIPARQGILADADEEGRIGFIPKRE